MRRFFCSSQIFLIFECKFKNTKKAMEIQVSSDFKKRARAAITAIILFVIVYVLLFFASITLTVACIAGAIALLSIKINLIMIVLALGLASIGVLVSYFLIKFLFKNMLTIALICSRLPEKQNQHFLR